MSLVFLHLSDIHFRGLRASQLDLDREIRGELERDVAALAEQHGPVDWILVGGDIAFSGKPPEYDEAVEWLASLCDLVGCDRTSVLTVPGNHDVDWAVVERSSGLMSQHAELRMAPTSELGWRLERMLDVQRTDRHLLFSAIEAYNSFAARFECQVTVECLRWEKTLPLDSTYHLCILGLTSTLSSDRSDGRSEDRRIVLGPHQCLIERRDKIVYLALCHHPYEWLRDKTQARAALKKANLVLFGHEHRPAVDKDGHMLRIDAGAVQPERGERWSPSFSMLRLDVQEGSPNQVVATLRPRVWNEDECMFDADGEPERTFSLDVESERPNRGLPTSIDDDGLDRRKLVYDFMSLPYGVGLELARSAGLLTAADDAVPDGERYERIFSRARERGLLAQMREQIDSKMAQRPPDPRPTEKGS